MTAESALRSMPRVGMMVVLCAAVQGCSGSTASNPTQQGTTVTGGSPGSGGVVSSTGTANSSHTSASGGITSTGGVTAIGGTVSSSGANSSKATSAVGGETSTATGGTSNAAGASVSGGAITTGGSTGTGGRTGAGGTTRSGGATATGGRTGAGGTTRSGSATATGGTAAGTGVATGGAVAGGVGGSNAGTTGGSSGTGGKTTGTGGSAQCTGTSTLRAGDNKATLQFRGLSRSYLVHVPSSVKAGTAVPLIFDFHGSGGSSTQEESASGWKQKADANGFIMVYPDGVGKAWNVGNCCGDALAQNVDDVGFTRAMIAAVSQAACIDPKRVYVTGMSNGAGLAHRLACEAADVIAAIAAASADLVTDPCTPARPISELSIRGLDDTLVAYAGGNTGSTGWYSPGAKGTLDLWKAIDQCTGSETTSLQYCESYLSCSAGVEITLCSLPNTSHDTYNNSVGLSVPDIAWEMFQRQPMP